MPHFIAHRCLTAWTEGHVAPFQSYIRLWVAVVLDLSPRDNSVRGVARGKYHRSDSYLGNYIYLKFR